MKACDSCHYYPWPCASCGVPRCYCREQDVYRHHRGKAEPVPLPSWKFYKCGHPVEPWNVMEKDGNKCRTCWNAYMRAYRQRRAG